MPMKQSIQQFLGRLTVLSKLENCEADEIAELYDFGPVKTMENTAEIFINEPRPARSALKAFLYELPPDVLLSMVVLMYAGRDGEEELRAVDTHCAPNVSYMGVASSIAEKRSRMEYINGGVKSLGKSNLLDLQARVQARLEQVQAVDDRPVLRQGPSS